MPGHDIIVVGGSAGAVEAVRELARELPADLAAAVFVVLHFSPHAQSFLPAILNRAGPLPAVHAADGERIEPGRIYVAPPDHHLLISSGHVHLSLGPRESGTRPAVNPLFRTAARAYGPRVVGVVLSGWLDDGTAGLLAIEEAGGVTMVQDPAEAIAPAMPANAREYVDVDHVLPVAAIARLLGRLAREPVAEEALRAAGGVSLDLSPAEQGMYSQGPEQKPGPASGFTCPECAGALWEERTGQYVQYRCRIGHIYSEQTLVAAQIQDADELLTTSLTALEEAAALARRMVDRIRDRGGDAHRAERQARQAEAIARRAEAVRQALLQEVPAEPEREET